MYNRGKEHLAYKKQPSPQDHHRALGTSLLQGPRGVLFLISEVPLYRRDSAASCEVPLYQTVNFGGGVIRVLATFVLHQWGCDVKTISGCVM